MAAVFGSGPTVRLNIGSHGRNFSLGRARKWAGDRSEEMSPENGLFYSFCWFSSSLPRESDRGIAAGPMRPRSSFPGLLRRNGKAGKLREPILKLHGWKPVHKLAPWSFTRKKVFGKARGGNIPSAVTRLVYEPAVKRHRLKE